jgi:hypothetical protein
MQALLRVILLLTLSLPLSAQVSQTIFGNEWIQSQQTYYKFQLTEDGIYRIPLQHLIQSGIPAQSIAANEWQLFHMGQEIPIHVQQTGGQLDYIEFYGQKNRASLDYGLHADSSFLFNPDKSLITDTAAYFLSWKTGGQGLRYQNRTANLSNFLNPIPYYIHTEKANLVLQWNQGKVYELPGYQLSKSEFEYGEGWGTTPTQYQTHNISADHIYETGPDAEFKLRIHSTTAYTHRLQILHNAQLRIDRTFARDTLLDYRFSVPATQLNGNHNLVVRGLNGSIDRHSISQLELAYPRKFDFGGKSAYYFELEASNQRQSLEIENFMATTQNVYLFDLANQRRIHCFWDGQKVRADLLPCSNKRQLLLIDLGQSTEIKLVGRLEAVNFRNFNQLDADYIIISHPQLFRDSEGKNPVLEYAAYRASTGFQPIIIEVQELFDQFAYGLNMHPQAFRNFADFIQSNWTNPQHIFLIGKGRNYQEVRDFFTYDHLIPSFGYPASDQLLFAKRGQIFSQISVGRLAASSADQVSNYLKKIKKTELAQLSDPAWSKNLLHLSGGKENNEQQYFQDVLATCAQIARHSDWGANSYSFSPKIQPPKGQGSTAIFDSLNQEGFALLSYLGHAFPHKVDVDFSPLLKERQNDRFPAIFSFSCSNGNIYSDQIQMSEDFIFKANAGAVMYLGFVQPISLSSADDLAQELYQHIGQNYTMGELIQKSILELGQQPYYSDFDQMACQFLSCHGDPAFNLFPAKGADFRIKALSAPTHIDPKEDIIALEVEIENTGLAVNKPLVIKIYNSNSEQLLLQETILSPDHLECYRFELPISPITIKSNQLNYRIVLDPDSLIAEWPEEDAERNNEAAFSVEVIQNKIIALAPQNFAISTETSLKLLASVRDLAGSIYELEVDLSPNFNSAALIQADLVLTEDGILKYESEQELEDSLVYYWRLRALGANDWTTFSFIHLGPQTSGWNQSSYNQLYQNNLEAMQWIDSLEETTYAEASFSRSLRYTDFGPYLYQEFAEYEKCRCNNADGVYVHVIDPTDLSAWQLEGGSSRFGARNCDPAGRSSYSFLFETSQPQARIALENFLKDTIPSGFYVLVYTLNDANARQWSNTLINWLTAQNASQTQALIDNLGPWAFFFQKDQPSFKYQAESTSPEGLETVFPTSFEQAYMQSPILGPALRWDSLEWSIKDKTMGFASRLNVYGWNKKGERLLIYQNIDVQGLNLQDIDASKFPKIQLEWVNLEHEQLQYWRVFYQKTADLSFEAHAIRSQWKDSYEKEEFIQLEVVINNSGAYPSDSSLLYYKIMHTDIEGQIVVDPLNVNQQTSIRLPLFDLSQIDLDQLELLLELNPERNILEQFYFNNSLMLNANLEKIQPQMQVFLNEKLQENGARLLLENKLNVHIQDPSAVLNIHQLEDYQIEITAIDELQRETLDSYSAWVEHYELKALETTMDHGYDLELKLQLPKAGNYHLSIRPKQDDISEEMTALAYELEFYVAKQTQIGQLKAFPNPVKTSTTFSFEWQGPEQPEQMSIDIINLNGQVLHQIQIEASALTDGYGQLQWDAKDASGQKLPAGQYIYRLNAQTSSSQQDQKIISSFGKLILVN